MNIIKSRREIEGIITEETRITLTLLDKISTIPLNIQISKIKDKITIGTAKVMIIELNLGLMKGLSISRDHRNGSPQLTDLKIETEESEAENSKHLSNGLDGVDLVVGKEDEEEEEAEEGLTKKPQFKNLNKIQSIRWKWSLASQLKRSQAKDRDNNNLQLKMKVLNPSNLCLKVLNNKARKPDKVLNKRYLGRCPLLIQDLLAFKESIQW